MNILDYIERIKRENEGPRITAQEPRTMMAKADIPDAFNPDLEQSEFLRPGETLETWKPNPFLKPHAEGGRIGLQGGQLVRNTVDGSRPGYAKNPRINAAIKLTLKEAAEIRKTLPNGIGLYKDARGTWLYNFFSRDKNGDVYQKTRTVTSKNSDIDGALKFLKEDREIFIKNNFPNRMTEKTFENLRWLDENVDLTKSAFADKLNELGHTTYQGNKFTVNTVMDWEKKLGIDKLRPKRTIRTVNEAKNIIRTTTTGKGDIADLYKITDKGLRDAAIKKKAVQITGRNKAIAETGTFAGTTTKEAKLFRNFYEAHTKVQQRIEIGGTWDGKDMSKRKNWPRDANGNVNWDIKGKNGEPAWKSVEFTDTQTPKGKTTFTYKNLANQVDNTFGSGFFARSTTPYTTQKELYGKNIMFEGKMQPVGKVLARKAIIQNYQKEHPGKMPSEKYINNRMRAYAPGQVHHWAEGGVGADPYKVQFTSGAANRAVNNAEKTYKAALNKAGTNTDKINAAKKSFIKSIEDISGKHGGIQYTVEGTVIGDKPSKISPYVSAAKETGLDKQKSFKSLMHELNVGKSTLAYHTLKKGDIPIDTVCFRGRSKKASGGRIGFQTGSAGQVCGIDFAQNKPNEFLKRISKMKGADTFLRSAAGLKVAKGLLGTARYWTSPLTLGGGEAWYSYLTYLNEKSKGKSMASSINSALWFFPGNTKRDMEMLAGYEDPRQRELLPDMSEEGFKGMNDDQKKMVMAMQLGHNINKQGESEMALAINEYTLRGDNPDMPIAQISPHRDLTEQQQRERNILEARSKAHLKGLREKEAEGEDLFKKYRTLVKKSEGTFTPSDEQLWAPFKKLKERTQKQMVSEFNKSLSEKYMQGDPWSGKTWSKTKAIFGMGPDLLGIRSWLDLGKTRKEEKKIDKMLEDVGTIDDFEGRKDLYRYNIGERGLKYLRGPEDLTAKHYEDYYAQHPYLQPIFNKGGRVGYTNGGLTRTVAPDSGPMSQGIMGTRTGFQHGSKKKTPWYLWPYKRAQEWDKIIERIKERLVSSNNNDSN